MAPTMARLAQIIELSKRGDTHTLSMIRELAKRALADDLAQQEKKATW